MLDQSSEMRGEGDGFELSGAFLIIDTVADLESTVVQLRDFLGVDHLVYHSSKLGARPSVDPFIRLTYPAEWIKRYLQSGYVDIDPVLREGFARTLPFDWSELAITTPAEAAFLADAMAHGVGPHGLSIPVRNKHGHRGLFSISCSRAKQEWDRYRRAHLPALIEIANRIHRRAIKDALGENKPHLTEREIDCLRWTSLGKHAGEIAVILNISPHTARDYLKSARFKLDCVTSAQAVRKAVTLGFLGIPGGSLTDQMNP